MTDKIRAHVIDQNGLIINTIVVTNLKDFPNLVDAGIGGGIGDSIINGQLVPAVQQGAANGGQ